MTQNTELSSKPISKTKLVLGGSGSNAHTIMENSPILSPLVETGGGILFDNTPNISVQFGAQYSLVELSHTNYDFQAYSKSSVANITVASKFMARTLYEADYMLAAIQFMRTYSKMNFGEFDQYRGNPPAILKFSCYGDYMINDSPVALRNFTLQLPEHVDYVQTSHNTQVPIYLELTFELAPMPTPNKVRREFSLEEFGNGSLLKRGYL